MQIKHFIENLLHDGGITFKYQCMFLKSKEKNVPKSSLQETQGNAELNGNNRGNTKNKNTGI